MQLDRDVYPPRRPDTADPPPEGNQELIASARLKREDVVRSGMMTA